jgi:hypothetical protein
MPKKSATVIVEGEVNFAVDLFNKYCRKINPSKERVEGLLRYHTFKLRLRKKNEYTVEEIDELANRDESNQYFIRNNKKVTVSAIGPRQKEALGTEANIAFWYGSVPWNPVNTT